MNSKIKQAILSMYVRMEQAHQKQVLAGRLDQGNRSRLTSGLHLNPLIDLMADDLVTVCGFTPEMVFTNGNALNLPGWYRPMKRWDITAYQDNRLVAALELKTINSSFGNNLSNRIEEAIGVACDAKTACDDNLMPSSIPPALCYVMIVTDNEDSAATTRIAKSDCLNYDPIYDGASYQDRARIFCERLRQKGLYQAVWLVVANPQTSEVTEPSPDLTYDKFLASIKGHLAGTKA